MMGACLSGDAGPNKQIAIASSIIVGARRGVAPTVVAQWVGASFCLHWMEDAITTCAPDDSATRAS
jgi:hypothetical protein